MNTLITPLCKEAGNPIRVSKEPRVPGKEKKIDVKIQQPGIKKKKDESCENILLVPLKDKQKEVLCT